MKLNICYLFTGRFLVKYTHQEGFRLIVGVDADDVFPVMWLTNCQTRK